MCEVSGDTQYKQLNERSRWYSSQLWHVPFAYVALLGLGLEKVLTLSTPLKSTCLAFLGLFSMSVFVHVTALKHYERIAVRNMQEMERKVISSGGSAWYLSHASYIKAMLGVAIYVLFDQFVLVAKPHSEVSLWLCRGMITIWFGVILIGDNRRRIRLIPYGENAR